MAKMPANNQGIERSDEIEVQRGRINLQLLRLIAFVTIASIVVLFAALSAFGTEGGAKGLHAATTLLIIGGGMFALGAALGFLFGVPKTTAGDATFTRDDQGATTMSEQASLAASNTHRVNSNLEDVSDWLVKIIIGASLVQIQSIGTSIYNTSSDVGKAIFNDRTIAGHASGQFLVLGVLAIGFFTGFLFGYLWTRLVLQGLIGFSDLNLVATLKDQLNKTRQAMKQNDDTLKGVTQLLAGEWKGTNEDLAAKIRAASHEVRSLVFYRTRDALLKNLKAEDADIFDRTKIVLTALIEADKAIHGGSGKFHRNYGLLGVAKLYDEKPDFEEIRKLFETAATLRNDEIEDDDARRKFNGYELGQAICIINSDAKFEQNSTSDAAVVKRVFELTQRIDDVSGTFTRFAPKYETVFTRFKDKNSTEWTALEDAAAAAAAADGQAGDGS